MMTGRERRVLVVDDDPGIRAVLAEFLTDAGHRVATATNGLEALAALSGGPSDVILLDMLMPKMDGWAFAREYRRSPWPHARIIVTAATDAKGRAAEIGAAGHCEKPFDLDRLLGLIEEPGRGGGRPAAPTGG